MKISTKAELRAQNRRLTFPQNSARRMRAEGTWFNEGTTTRPQSVMGTRRIAHTHHPGL